MEYTEIPPRGQREGIFCDCFGNGGHAIHTGGDNPTRPKDLIYIAPVGSHIPSGDTHNAADLHRRRTLAGINAREANSEDVYCSDPPKRELPEHKPARTLYGPFATTDTRLGWLTVAESITVKRRDAQDG